ncbi:hypothetical protein ABK905_21950 [Acerihabitans sp. KWT182]|uniref:Uncharacterized protein n=1 Tax=Acerihabitans sp. KWT182 TaxID=3157919 RepID=A0AAU7Q7S9_9GAMM
MDGNIIPLGHSKYLFHSMAGSVKTLPINDLPVNATPPARLAE